MSDYFPIAEVCEISHEEMGKFMKDKLYNIDYLVKIDGELCFLSKRKIYNDNGEKYGILYCQIPYRSEDKT